MRWMSRAFAMVAVLIPTLAGGALAQRRAAASVGVASDRVAALASATPSAQQPQVSPAVSGPDWSLFAGVASGDNPYDIGIALGAAAKWNRSDWPVAIRGDAYYAHHSGDVGTTFGGTHVSINIFGAIGGAEYAFETENRLKPYVFGGIGLFYLNSSSDASALANGYYDGSTDLGFGVGGGVKFTPKFGVELRFMDLGGFNTIPILAAFHF